MNYLDYAAIPPEQFYGPPTLKQLKIESNIRKQQTTKKPAKLPKYLLGLLSPSRTWKVFKKQALALEFAQLKRNGLMVFAFEQSDGNRLFLTCHPKYFWFIYSARPPIDRCSYEVIPEHSACKLYLDIEFNKKINESQNGEKMLNIFLKIINFNLKEKFKIDCMECDILDLDSTTSEKFSRHIIYNLKDAAFEDNYSVGIFVKQICQEIKTCTDKSALIEISKKYNIPQEDVSQLFLYNKDGQKILFCDEGVYTKNRHFRLLGSTKRGKHAPLMLAQTNKFKISENYEKELSIFLSSLVTYFENEPQVVSLKEEIINKNYSYSKNKTNLDEVDSSFHHTDIDKFIEQLIAPRGRIRRKAAFSSSNILVYEILGYRFCYNINREHKSNNIKYIVDLNSFSYHQKCYDPECSNFKSNRFPLPETIKLLYEDENVLRMFDECCLQQLDDFELLNVFDESFDLESGVPDYGLSDEALLDAVKEVI